MAHRMGESRDGVLKLDFDRRLMLQFCRSVVTSDPGLLAYLELDDAIGLSAVAGENLADINKGKNGRHALVGMLRQSVFGRLAGYDKFGSHLENPGSVSVRTPKRAINSQNPRKTPMLLWGGRGDSQGCFAVNRKQRRMAAKLGQHAVPTLAPFPSAAPSVGIAELLRRAVRHHHCRPIDRSRGLPQASSRDRSKPLRRPAPSRRGRPAIGQRSRPGGPPESAGPIALNEQDRVQAQQMGLRHLNALGERVRTSVRPRNSWPWLTATSA